MSVELAQIDNANIESPRRTSSNVDRNPRWEWLIPAGLIFLSLVPAVGGSFRLAELSGSAEVSFLPDSERIASAPVLVVIHIISVITYSILGAFQFAPGFRRRHRRWHRMAGRMGVTFKLRAKSLLKRV